MLTSQKNLHLDILVIRPVIVLLIVLLHSMTVYAKGWTMPDGIGEVRPYYWIARFSISFTLECFTFISGILAARQLIYSSIDFRRFLQKKFLRLYLPAIVFGIIYFCCFHSYVSIQKSIYLVLNGCGHLWYLPMLFWCSIMGWLIAKIGIPDRYKLLALLLLALVSGEMLSLKFRWGDSCYYLFFYYLGVVYYKRKTQIDSFFEKNRLGCWVVAALFLLCFFAMTPLKDAIWENLHHPMVMGREKLFQHIAVALMKIVISLLGLCTIFWVTHQVIKGKNVLNRFLLDLNSKCFGVFIIHQFIIFYLYYYTPFPRWLGSIGLPIITFPLTLALSYLLATVMLRSRVGRYILG